MKARHNLEVKLSLSEIVKRNADECSAAHPWIDPWAWTWASTEQWDMANANWDELNEREPDLDLIRQADDLSHAGDFSAAMPIWINLAEQGSVRSMLELGGCYEHGCGVPLDLVQAENWYKQALAGGSQYAMLKCAHFAASRRDFAECKTILQAGVDDRWASAAFWQAWYRYKQCDSKENYRSIFALLKAAAKCGHSGGKSFLANFMVRGKFGILRIPMGLFRTCGWPLQRCPAIARKSEISPRIFGSGHSKTRP